MALENFSKENSLGERYHLLNAGQKYSLHLRLLKVLSRRTRRTRFQEKKYNEVFTHNSTELINIFIDQAHASSDEDSSIRCNFGGWMSILNEQAECVPPWKKSVRSNPRLEVFGDTYTRDYSCGGGKLFRCNPVLFGPGEDGKGICATANDSDPSDSTNACMNSFLSEEGGIRKLIDDLQSDPEKLSSYLAIVTETLRFCQEEEESFLYCDQLTETLLNISGISITCENQESLKSYLPDIITPFNLEELDSITNGLGTAALEYAEELARRQKEVRLKNRAIYKEAIASYQQDQRIIDTIDRIRDNSDKCISDSCDGTRWSRSKPSGTSVAKCARYVKYAMFPPGSSNEGFGTFSEYPWGTDAVESGAWLRDKGFVNLMDIPEMSHLTPETAPVGSILVYDKPSANRRNRYVVDGVNRGGPGHIEIKASENEYISDFINDEPTTIGGERRPIGIYVQIPSEFSARLQEVPVR